MQDRRIRRRRGDRIDHRRQRAVVDADVIERILGEIAVGRADDRDRFADIAHPIDRDPVILHRRRESDDQRIGQRGDVLSGDHRPHAGALPAPPSMSIATISACGMRRAQDRRMQRSCLHRQVVDELAAPSQQRRIFDPQHALTDIALGAAATAPDVLRRSFYTACIKRLVTGLKRHLKPREIVLPHALDPLRSIPASNIILVV